MIVNDWTAHQWISFAGFTVAGLATLALLGIVIRTVRGWTAPAHAPAPRPVRPIPAAFDQLHRIQPLVAGPVARPLPVGALPVILGAEDREVIVSGFWDTPTQAVPPVVVDPTAELVEIAEHLAPGPGSLATLQEVGEGSTMRVTHDDIVDPEVAAWFDKAFTRIMDDFRTVIAPAMQTARLWEVQGRGYGGVLGAGRAGLDHWRIECPTGEWPLVAITDVGFREHYLIDGSQ